MNEIDIVVPVYKEEAGISLFDNALRNVLRPIETKYSFKIIYVLDRSPDGSYELLKALTNSSRNTTVLHLSSRFGHQMSLVAGLDQCRGDAVIMMDGDL